MTSHVQQFAHMIYTTNNKNLKSLVAACGFFVPYEHPRSCVPEGVPGLVWFYNRSYG